MITFPISTFVLLLVAVLVVYDFVATVVVPNSASNSMFTRKNYPIRLALFGLIAVIGAGIQLFIKDWITGTILIVGTVVAIVGLVWHAATHPRTNQ